MRWLLGLPECGQRFTPPANRIHRPLRLRAPGAPAGHGTGLWTEITPQAYARRQAEVTAEGDGMAAQVGVGLVGSGFIAQMHAEAFAQSTIASVRAVASRSADRVAEFARQQDIPAWHTDFSELVERPDVDLVWVAAPNHLHRDIVVAAARPASTSSARSRSPGRCRGRRDDRRVPTGRGEAHVRRGDLLRPEVRAGQGARRRGRPGPVSPGAAGRAALRPALGLVLGRRAVRRWRPDGHGLPRCRVRPLDVRQAGRPSRSPPSSAVRARPTGPTAEDHAIVTVRFEGNRRRR